jgi:hypothetical protein
MLVVEDRPFPPPPFHHGSPLPQITTIRFDSRADAHYTGDLSGLVRLLADVTGALLRMIDSSRT